jgi:signal transduction histidine kinase
MKISTKLIASFSIMAGLAITAGILSYDQMSKLSVSFDTVKNKSTPTIIELGNIKSSFNKLHADVLAYNLHVPDAANDPQVRQLALDHLTEVQMSRADLLHFYESYAIIEDNKFEEEAIGIRINGIVALTDEMVTMGSQLMSPESDSGHTTNGHSHTMAGDDNMATTTGGVVQLHELIQEFDGEAMVFREELNARIDEEFISLENTQATVLSDIERSTNLNMLLTVGAVAIVFTVGGLAAYSITRRVSKLKGEANHVAAGNLNQHIATTGSDEITDLAQNFEHMRKSLVTAHETLASKNKELRTLNVDLEQANEALKKLDKLKDQFVAIASHELRGPVHPILGYASMAKSGKMKPDIALDVIYKQALKLKQLAGDILDVSRIESETLTYKMQKTKIHEILVNAMVAAGGLVNPKEVSVITDIDKQYEDLEISADRDRIGQVFTNIIGNATKFTRKGSIRAETHVNKDSNTLEILIIDTGGGIPEDLLPQLFGKFVTKNIGNMNKEGSGLGLYISKAIVTAHSGTIQVYNQGNGAVFKIVLPIQPIEEKIEILAQPIRGY